MAAVEVLDIAEAIMQQHLAGLAAGEIVLEQRVQQEILLLCPQVKATVVDLVRPLPATLEEVAAVLMLLVPMERVLVGVPEGQVLLQQ
ncbi:MAG: hypothetical protein EBT70_17145 [Betaproteobacteria bacterium]|nr:hypothetical protein [Betaproteobacteria bacterium]